MRIRYLVIGALAALLLAPGFLVAPVAKQMADRLANGCLDMEGVDIDTGTWPAVARSLLGRLDGVTTTADTADLGLVSVRDLRFTADRVEFAPAGLLLLNHEVRVRGGRAEAKVDFADLERELSIPGVGIDFHGEGERLVATVSIPFLRAFDVATTLNARDGDLEIALDIEHSISLPPLHIDIPTPAQLTDVSVETDHLDVNAAVDGTIDLDTVGCPTTGVPT